MLEGMSFDDLESNVQRFVGKTISEMRFFKDEGMLAIGFSDGGTLMLPIASKT